MQLTILPEEGDFATGTGNKIEITYSHAGTPLSIGSLTPTAPSANATTLEDLLGAKALAASGAAILALSTLF